MKVTFVGAVKSAFVNFAKFRGVSSRAQYWYFVLFSVLLAAVLGTIEALIWPPIATEDVLEALNQPTPLSNIAALVILSPTLAVTARRVQDAGWSGKWLFTLLLPMIPLVFGVIDAINYLEFVTVISDQDLLAVAGYFLPALLLAMAVQIFLLVLCLRPSKSADEGNRFA